jgi:simple sugar transport system ATP-binding protein
MAESYLLELIGMHKVFPDVIASNNINLKIKSGEIHALLGENGAGKSTLVRMIYGILKPDAGEIYFDGKKVSIDSPAHARELGVAMVFQHFSLFDSLTVVENISLGMDHANDLKQLASQISEVSQHYGLPLDPQRHVYTLSVGERQRIEIIRCLLQQPKLLIMDEPTSVLTPQEVDKLFVTLRCLSAEGMAILYISHKLNEIVALCHYATILRSGKKVSSVAIDNETAASLATMMMGEKLQSIKPTGQLKPGNTRLKVTNLELITTDPLGISLKNINLEVRAGEVVAIAGIAGNGQDELLKALNGEQASLYADCIKLEGQLVGKTSPNKRRLLGLASVPEKRLGHGTAPDMSLIDNSFLTAYQRMNLIIKGLIHYPKTARFTEKIINDYAVKTPSANTPAASLSGGNLQKFIIGRELSQQPNILIVAQPTWGLDAGAALTIQQSLRNLATNGAAVLVISQDLDELMEISDRIGAICAGSLSTFYPTHTMTTEKIGMLMAGVPLDMEMKNDAASIS